MRNVSFGVRSGPPEDGSTTPESAWGRRGSPKFVRVAVQNPHATAAANHPHGRSPHRGWAGGLCFCSSGPVAYPIALLASRSAFARSGAAAAPQCFHPGRPSGGQTFWANRRGHPRRLGRRRHRGRSRRLVLRVLRQTSSQRGCRSSVGIPYRSSCRDSRRMGGPVGPDQPLKSPTGGDLAGCFPTPVLSRGSPFRFR
jgi:hypothetical protein